MQSIRSAAAAGVVVAAVLGSVAPPAAAAAADGTAAEEVWTGQVVATHSRWAHGKTTIVTESVLRTDSGEEVTLRQPGGSVDGIGMVVLHSPPVLRVGDRVRARVALARDLAGRVSRPVRELHGIGPGGGAVPFVRTEATKTRAQLAWASGCALIHFHEAGTTHIEGDLEFEEMRRVLIRWRHDIQDCSYFDLRDAGTASGEVGLDGINLVIFREDRWCRPATQDEPEVCHDHGAAGLTTLFFIDDEKSDRNGTLLDADIELNALDFKIAVDHQSLGPAQLCESDLANTFTHEIGHLMGLDHTCWNGSDARLNDDLGDPLPLCSMSAGLPVEVSDATMYNYQDCGETKKSSPEPDDIDGICAIYPLADDPHECLPAELDTGGGCTLAGAHDERGPGTLLLGALAFLALLLARRPPGSSQRRRERQGRRATRNSY